MSTLKVTNIQATGETASRAVSGVAGAHFAVNLTGTTYLGISGNSLSTQSVNTASFTDNGTGDVSVNLSSAFSNNSYTFVCGAIETNNNRTIKTTSTSSVVSMKMNDADTSTAQDSVGYAAIHGDLA